MNACASKPLAPLRDVHDEISNLAKEIVLVGVPVDCSISHILIGIRIDDSYSVKRGAGKKGRHACGIANHLRVVVHRDWFANKIFARWEVYNGRRNGGGVTGRFATTSVAGRHGTVDCIRVVSDTVTLRTVLGIEHVPEDFVIVCASVDDIGTVVNFGKPVCCKTCWKPPRRHQLNQVPFVPHGRVSHAMSKSNETLA